MENSARYKKAVADYQAGAAISLVTSNGSCHCGDTTAVICKGIIHCHGKEEWQKFEGRIEDCKVPYGMAALAKAIHAGMYDPPYPTQGTRVVLSK